MVAMKGEGKSGKSVVVTVSDDALETIDSVAKKLAAKGLKVTQVMPLTGVITGSISGKGFGELESIPGVASVEDDLKVQI
jgi:hypothetical protein